jgi:peroxin-5
MADCGASGTTLDQATRAILGGRSSTAALNAQKQVESLLGHTALTGTNRQALPHAPPEFVSPGNGDGWDGLLSVMPNRSNYMHYSNQRGHPQLMATQMENHLAAHHQANYAARPNMNSPYNLIQMQHQRAMAVAAQQQMHHQQLIFQRHTDAQRAQSQSATAQASTQAATEHSEVLDVADALDGYYDEGAARGVSMDELAAAWAEVQDNGFDSTVQGATIEELARAWSEAQSKDFDTEVDPSFQFHSEAENQALSYQFFNDVRNTEMPPDTSNFMEQGMQHFRNGNVAEAIRNFEMELQLNDPDSSSAWLLLGRCHAENDQDREAIVCLETAVEKDPYSSEALLALGVSYVNELNHVKALAALKSWVNNNSNYANLELSAVENLYSEADGGAKNNAEVELQDLLLKALAHDPDPSVWEALGVAANVSRDFDSAVEAFEKAIDASPQDYQLWNKLGATLANSNQSAKALQAYQKAIALRPGYARAWLNMAISHSNLQDYDEAARCYLQTLSLNPGAVHCWSYLRVALTCAERWDLIPAAASQNLEAFQDSFDFVRYG